MNLDLSEVIDAIAEAVVAKIAEAGGTVASAPEKTAAAPAKKADKAPAKKAAVKKPAVDRDAVYEQVKAYGEKAGKPAAREVIAEFAASFGEVSDEDLPSLLANIEAKLAEDDDAL